MTNSTCRLPVGNFPEFIDFREVLARIAALGLFEQSGDGNLRLTVSG
jgi:hypothetical protein